MFSFQKKPKASAGGDDNEEEEEDAPRGLLGGVERVNPNRQIKPTEKMTKVKNMNSTEAPADPEVGMSRKERYIFWCAHCSVPAVVYFQEIAS